ncbi:MAG: hypothetical protein JRI66_13105 [Deltaproteobacteria bacterium]|nr:hypothetical protein [Deltaproteobacteria bacterium]
MLLLIYTLAFVAVTLLTFTLVTLWTKRSRVKARFSANPEAEISTPFLRPKPPTSPVKEQMVNWLSLSGQWALKDPKGLSETQEKLIHAGYRQLLKER